MSTPESTVAVPPSPPTQMDEIPSRLPSPQAVSVPTTPLRRWLLANQVHPVGPEQDESHAKPQAWWKVMCLTGVDYYSSLAYVPGIAALAAGAFSPVAMGVIVLLTLGGMLPMYRRVAGESPHGQGSVAMLEHLLPFWRGKGLVLALLGFVATSWIITITLSAADAALHVTESPLTPAWMEHAQVPLTIFMLVLLGAVFLKGFSEAVGIAIPLVAVFLVLNAIVIGRGIVEIVTHPDVLSNWQFSLTSGGGWSGMITASLLAFPLLVLGLSGFETGVSMMPLISAEGATPAQRLASRIANARKLLATAALIMSVFLIGTSTVTTLLIPKAEFSEGGSANGRAMAFLAHEYLGNGFGTAYDISTILILWFAGGSAMAGLINIVPRYLPSYGMAPEWGRAVRPVVLVYTALCILITIIFKADVDAQAGAYATGILAMMVSGALAVAISSVRKNMRTAAFGFGLLTIVLLYALVANIIRKPSGIVISTIFIIGIVLISLVSRISRSTELRVDHVELSDEARQYILDSVKHDGSLDILAHKPFSRGVEVSDHEDYAAKELQQRTQNAVPGLHDVLFLEVVVVDPSEFSGVLKITGKEKDEFRVLRVESAAVPNAIAASLLALRDAVGLIPHCYFEWSEGAPVSNLMRFLFLGQGDTAPVVREIIRQVEPDPARRPVIHVG